jgi:hypothetical protein
MLPQSLEVLMDSLQQCGKGGPRMIMSDFAARPAPEPLDPVGVRVIGGCVDEPQVVVTLRHHLAHQLRTRWRLGAQIVDAHDRHTALGARTGDSRPHLGTKDLRRAAGGEASVKPPVAPVDEPEAIDFVVGTGRFDQALSPSAFATLEAGQGGMERALDLVLEIDIGTREQGQ